MQAYLTVVSLIGLLGFYGAMVILARVVPAFLLQVEDGPVIRQTLATALGVATATFPLWWLHWGSLRQLWQTRVREKRSYLLGVSSLGLGATAMTGGWLVTRLAMLMLDPGPASVADWARVGEAALLFGVSYLLWYHHWGLLRQAMALPQRPGRQPAAVSSPPAVPQRTSPHRQRAA